MADLRKQDDMTHPTRGLHPHLTGAIWLAVTFAACLIGGLAAHSAEQPTVVEFTTTPPAVTALDATEAARAHAAEHGLTSCTTPDKADLDDVILTVPADESGAATSSNVTAVTFDEALQSGGKRRNVLACDPGRSRLAP